MSPAITLPSRPSVRRPRILISPENIRMSERRCGPANENEARRQLRGRRSRNVLGGQQTPDPVTEGPAWSPKTANRPKFRCFSSTLITVFVQIQRWGEDWARREARRFPRSLLKRCVFKLCPRMCQTRPNVYRHTRPLSGSSCGKRSDAHLSQKRITEPHAN